MRRIIAVATVVAALGVGATCAMAAPPTAFEQGQKLCERQGGTFTAEGGSSYLCQVSGGATFTSRDSAQAERLCSRNGGVFADSTSTQYRCNGPV